MVFWQFILLGLGTVLIRGLQAVRRRIEGPDRYFTFADFLSEERTIQTGGFAATALAPVVGGALLFAVPSSQGATAAAAGFLAAFLGVWPVLQFPDQVINPYMLPYWPRLRLLYAMYIVGSSSLAYAGFHGAAWLVAFTAHAVGPGRWNEITTGLLTNALYDLIKAPVLLGVGGLLGVRYANRQRQALGRRADDDASNGPPLTAVQDEIPDGTPLRDGGQARPGADTQTDGQRDGRDDDRAASA